MIIKELIRRGTNHKNFCEDAVFSKEIDNITYLAVFDGCSTGDKSHFASELMSKIFKKSIRSFMNDDHLERFREGLPSISNMTAEEIMKNVFYYFFFNLSTAKTILEVDIQEILSTLVLSVIKKNVTSEISPEGTPYCEVKTTKYDVSVAMSGDGAFYINDELIVVDSPDNTPDYISYHLQEGVADAWRSMKTYNYEVDDITNFSIMSDGIMSFKKLNLENNINNWLTDDEEKFLIDKLFVDSKLSKSDAMLPRKMNILEKKGYNHFDDLSIIRVIEDGETQS